MISTAWMARRPARKIADMQSIWIEIPVRDLPRAATFYRSVFGHDETAVNDDGTRRITIVPGTPTVSLNQTEGFEPAAAGPLPYFTVDDLDEAVARAQEAGGRIVAPKTSRGEFGFFVLLLDSEGNHLYLHGSR